MRLLILVVLTSAVSLGLSQAAGDVFFPAISFEDDAVTKAFPSVAAALADTESLPSALFRLHSSGFLPFAQVIRHRRTLTSDWEELAASGNATIAADAELQLQRVRLVASAGAVSPLFRVLGKLVLEQCLVEGMDVGVSAVEGLAEIVDTVFRHNREVAFLLTGSAAISFSAVNVTNHTGTFLMHSSSFKAPAISLSDCVFLRNSPKSKGFLLELSAANSTGGEFSIANSSFESNQLGLLRISANYTNVTVAATHFAHSNATAIEVVMLLADIDLSNCSFSSNNNSLLDVHFLRGQASLRNISVSSHHGASQFVVANPLLSHSCLLRIAGLSVANSSTLGDSWIAGVVLITACTAWLSDVQLENTVLRSDLGMSYVGIVSIQKGTLKIDNMRMRNSGSSGQLITTVYSTVSMANCFFENSISQNNIQIGLVLSSGTFDNITITNSVPVKFESTTGLWSTVYFGLHQSHAELHNITVVQSPGYSSTAILAPIFSTYLLDTADIHHTSTDTILMSIESVGEIRSLRAYQCVFYMAVLQIASSSQFNLTDASIADSGFSRYYSGIAGIGRNCSVAMTELSVSNITANNIAVVKNAHLRVKGIHIARSHLESVFQNVIGALLDITELDYSDSTGGLVYGYSSTVSVSRALIQSVHAPKHLLGGSGTNITISDFACKHCSTGNALAHIREGSLLSLYRVTMQSVSSGESLGLLIDGGSLDITESSFTDFYCSLMQVTVAKLTLTSVQFSNGANFVQSLMSAIAYGGVLGCVDCISVLIDSVTVRNVTAKYGGAFSFRRSLHGETDSVAILNSWFAGCNATIGGAIYIRDVGFNITNCTFEGNLAGFSGGAIDASVEEERNRSLWRSTLVGNVAVEGGAVRWRNARVLTTEVIAAGNWAQYGPDFASYGVELTSVLTSFPENATSGYPLRLTYELLDHYGQRVSTAREEMLSLSSPTGMLFPGYQAIIRTRGLFNFTVPMVLGRPGTPQVIIASVRSIENGSIMQDLRTLTLRNCTFGEVQKEDRCLYCFTGHVSFISSDDDCAICPKQAFCSGGNNMTVNSHFWRSSPNSLNVLECPIVENCLQGITGTCAEGFQGKLCNECQDGYYRVQPTDCAECESSAVIIAKWVPLLGVLGLFLFAAVHFSANESDEYRLFVVKTGMNHAQLLSAITPLKTSMPFAIRFFLRGNAYVASFLTTDWPAACLGFTHEQYVKAGVAAVLLAVAALLTFAMCVTCAKWRRAAVVGFTSLLLFLPSVAIQSLFPLLACISVDDDSKWLFTDMSQRCWGETHYLMFFALFLPGVFLCVVLPAVSVAAIAKKWPALFRRYFPMWASGYRWVLWDLVQSLLKQALLMLMFGGLAFSRVGQFSGGLVIFYLLCFTNVFFMVKAYRIREAFWLSEVSYLIATVCFSTGGAYVFKEGGYSDGNLFFSITFLLLNSLFYMCICGLLLCKLPVQALPDSPVKCEAMEIRILRVHESVSGDCIVPHNSGIIDTHSRSHSPQ